MTHIDAQYVYDGDGKMVKSVITTYHGVAASTVTTTWDLRIRDRRQGPTTERKYYAGVAMRGNDTLFFTLRDHLGSTSVIADVSGHFVSEVR